MNAHAPIGHNNPPDPIDDIIAAYESTRIEAENWLDGSKVENEGQMAAVDEIIKDARKFRLALEAGQKSATAPLYDAYKAEQDRWKPTIADAKSIQDGLIAIVNDFKRELDARKEAELRKAREEANRKAREAAEAAAQANAGSIDDVRAAAEAQQAAEEAQKAAARASKEQVKGLRTVTRHAVENRKAVLDDIIANDRAALDAFIDEYARKHHKDRAINGVKVWAEKEAY